MEQAIQTTIQAFLASRDFADALVLAKRQENDPTWGVYVELFDNGSWRIIGPRSTHSEWAYWSPHSIIRSIPRIGDEEWQELLKVCGEHAEDAKLAQELWIWDEAMVQCRQTFLDTPNTNNAPHVNDEILRGRD
jgi:hypothetical protein